MKKTDLAYIAGLLDGEGTIHISNQLYLTIRIRNTNRQVLEWIREVMGDGNLYTDHRNGRNPCCSLELTAKRAIAFLEPLLPYLKIKKKQAELAFDFQRRAHGLTSGNRLTDKERHRRITIYYQMSRLNHPYATTATV